MERKAVNVVEATAAPLYITVGPQCCGKTTWLKSQSKQSSADILDVCLDDQRDVYVSIPTDRTLKWMETIRDSKNDDGGAAKSIPKRLKRVVQGKSLSERLQTNNVELIILLRRWKNQISSHDFEIEMTQYLMPPPEDRVAKSSDDATDGGDKQNGEITVDLTIEEADPKMTSLVKDWINTVESFLTVTPTSTPPKEIMLFCLESLFQPHPDTGQSAIESASQDLEQTPCSQPVAWGNTNSKCTDYVVALECALKHQRPVYFIKEERPPKDGNDGDDAEQYNNNSTAGGSIPRVPLTTLWHRNLQRFAKTGKYIPAMTIEMTRTRVDGLIEEAAARSKSSRKKKNDASSTLSASTDLEIDQALASMAGNRDYYFIMNDQRQIIKKSRRRRNMNLQQQGRGYRDGCGDNGYRGRGGLGRGGGRGRSGRDVFRGGGRGSLEYRGDGRGRAGRNFGRYDAGKYNDRNVRRGGRGRALRGYSNDRAGGRGRDGRSGGRNKQYDEGKRQRSPSSGWNKEQEGDAKRSGRLKRGG